MNSGDIVSPGRDGDRAPLWRPFQSANRSYNWPAPNPFASRSDALVFQHADVRSASAQELRAQLLIANRVRLARLNPTGRWWLKGRRRRIGAEGAGRARGLAR